MRSIRCLVVAAVCLAIGAAADLSKETADAFDKYIRSLEQKQAQEAATSNFLELGRAKRESVDAVQRQSPDIPGGVIQHWIGATFIPGVTIADVRSVMQDYNDYVNIYKPDVAASKLLKQDGNRFEIFLRLYKKQVLTVVFNANYTVDYKYPAADRMSMTSVANRIAEVKDPAHPDAGELPVGHDRGFLWRLNSYWRFEQADGGVYAECEAISLSRDVPRLVQGIVKSFVGRFPREGLRTTMEATKRAAMRNATAKR